MRCRLGPGVLLPGTGAAASTHLPVSVFITSVKEQVW